MDGSVETSEATVVSEEPVLYEKRGAVAVITMNRPRFANAQNDHMTYELDRAFRRAVNDDEVGAIVLRGEGKHFSSGHDLGTPPSGFVVTAEDRVSSWYGQVDKVGGERMYSREQEVYLGMCRRWRDLPKPTIAAVQGACIAGGLMLAWVCDIIVASEDAYFTDPVVNMGVPGVEYFAHAFELPNRIAREFLMFGEKMSAQRAEQYGMVNHVVPRDELFGTAFAMAEKLATRPRFALALTKQAFNMVDDAMGKRTSMEGVFGLHHLAHAHNQIASGGAIGGQTAASIKAKIG